MKWIFSAIIMFSFVSLNAQQENLDHKENSYLTTAINELDSKLNLTEMQRAKITELLVDYNNMTSDNPERDTVIENDGDLSDENRSPENDNYEKFSKDQNDARMKDESDQSSNLHSLREKYSSRIEDLLDDKQKEKWKQIKAQWWIDNNKITD